MDMENIYQPYTTETTIQGLKMARNAMRLRLWDDTDFAHKWLCHPNQDCSDGCDQAAIPSRLNLYMSKLED